MACGCKQGSGVTAAVASGEAAQVTAASIPIIVEYTGGCDPLEDPHQVIGAATNYAYGLHQCGDIFSIWSADLVVSPELFYEVGYA